MKEAEYKYLWNEEYPLYYISYKFVADANNQSRLTATFATTTSARTGIITVRAGNLTREIVVNQK